MITGLFASCFILAGAMFSSYDANAQTSSLNATLAFLNGSYYMKSRNYWDDWVFTNFNCVSRWGGRDKHPNDPIRIRYETKGYSGDRYGHQYEIKVVFYTDQTDKFYYDRWRGGKDDETKYTSPLTTGPTKGSPKGDSQSSPPTTVS